MDCILAILRLEHDCLLLWMHACANKSKSIRYVPCLLRHDRQRFAVQLGGLNCARQCA